MVDLGNPVVGDRPDQLPVPGAARRAEGKAVAVLDPAGLIRDGQRTLARHEDGKCLFCLRNGIVAAVHVFVGDCDLVGSCFRPVRRPVADIVLAIRDDPAMFVLDRDRRLVLLAVIGSAGGVELNFELVRAHRLPGDGHLTCQRFGRHVVVVAVALHTVPDGVITRSGAGGKAGGIGDVVRRVLHDAVR